MAMMTEQPKTFRTIKEMAKAWREESARLIASSRASERITGRDLQIRVGPCEEAGVHRFASAEELAEKWPGIVKAQLEEIRRSERITGQDLQTRISVES